MKRKWFRRNWLKFRKYVLEVIIAGAVVWLFVKFYREDNWLAISALATLVLAIAALRAINISSEQKQLLADQTQFLNEQIKLQEIQYRENILATILNWLIDIAECKSLDKPTKLSELQQLVTNAKNAKLQYSVEAMNVEGEYLKLVNKGKVIATNFHDKEKPLPKAIVELIGKLTALAKLNRQYSAEFPNLPDNIKIMDVFVLLGKYNTDAWKIHREKQEFMNTIMTEVTNLKYTKPFS